MVITRVSNSVDFYRAGFSTKASTEFTNDQGKTVSLSILSSSPQSLLVPGLAVISSLKRRLTGSTDGSRQLAAVGMIIQNLSGYILSTTWRLSEP